MKSAFWAVLAGVAVLWPARLAGPLDGVPLDQPAEVMVVGLLLAWLLATHGRFLRRPAARTLIVSLLLWKAATAAALVQDGWCLRFESPVSLFRGDVFVPHSWDVRADWRSPTPRCSAVMTEGFPVLERFPVWFFNLPPADPGRAAGPDDRPPNVTTGLSLEGFVTADRPGVFRLPAGENVRIQTRIDGEAVDAAELGTGVTLPVGLHHISVTGALEGARWSLMPTWNGTDVWRGTVATMAPPSAVDMFLRPWGRWLAPLLIGTLVLNGLASAARRFGDPMTLAHVVVLSAVMAGFARTGREVLVRLSAGLLFAGAVIRVPRRLHNLVGASWLIGLPVLALFAILGLPQVGLFTWYSSGDDWWMFQRYAYRIFMQGYWLEGGEPTFWFQPFYRWIAGSLHLVFGDSSVGELLWDAGCALSGALFAFHMTKVVAGFKWGIAAGGLTVALFLIGPAYYLFGRGLSEFSSAGFIYAAALFALRGRHGYWPAVAAAGILATLAFYTRLNNLPMAIAVALFALPPRLPVVELFRPGAWLRLASRPVLAGVLGALALGLWLFTARTYYYTQVPSLLFGTQSGLLSNWRPETSMLGNLSNVVGSLLMVLTMNDPARLDIRAAPVLLGTIVALAGVARIAPFGTLPLSLVGLCLAGLSSSLVARGSAYPGRFSVHLIPATVALTCCAAALVVSRARQRPRASGNGR